MPLKLCPDLFLLFYKAEMICYTPDVFACHQSCSLTNNPAETVMRTEIAEAIYHL